MLPGIAELIGRRMQGQIWAPIDTTSITSRIEPSRLCTSPTTSVSRSCPRGKVIAYSDTEGQGLISGDDGCRYTFLRGALGGDLRAVRPGQDVDFQVNGNQAESIYVIGQSGGQIGGKDRVKPRAVTHVAAAGLE
jgi:cold shock CspA family protein